MHRLILCILIIVTAGCSAITPSAPSLQTDTPLSAQWTAALQSVCREYPAISDATVLAWRDVATRLQRSEFDATQCDNVRATNSLGDGLSNYFHNVPSTLNVARLQKSIETADIIAWQRWQSESEQACFTSPWRDALLSYLASLGCSQ